ncbi:MAG: glucose-1-phosphate thymidylyltransferase, partial [Bacteroidota bacterium]
AAILNAEQGPIYIGKGAILNERAVLKGPVAIGAGTRINANAVVRNATTIGPHTRIGGEVSNSVILGYSNKAHEGFLGNSVVGEWCNLGAGTNTSNLRNDYREVKVWDYGQEDFGNTNLQFCGLFMGDHSKCSIHTMFNTGTVVGVSANLFGAGFTDRFVPSFAWGSPDRYMQTYRLDRALEVAKCVTRRRSIQFGAEDKAILTHIFRATAMRRVKDLA